MNTNNTRPDQESIFSVYDADNQRLGTFSAFPNSEAYTDRLSSVMQEYVSDQFEIYQHWPDGNFKHYATILGPKRIPTSEDRRAAWVKRLAELGAVVKEESK